MGTTRTDDDFDSVSEIHIYKVAYDDFCYFFRQAPQRYSRITVSNQKRQNFKSTYL